MADPVSRTATRVREAVIEPDPCCEVMMMMMMMMMLLPAYRADIQTLSRSAKVLQDRGMMCNVRSTCCGSCRIRRHFLRVSAMCFLHLELQKWETQIGSPHTHLAVSEHVQAVTVDAAIYNSVLDVCMSNGATQQAETIFQDSGWVSSATSDWIRAPFCPCIFSGRRCCRRSWTP